MKLEMINCHLYWTIFLAFYCTSCHTYYGLSPSFDTGNFETAHQSEHQASESGVGYHIEIGYRPSKKFGLGLTMGLNRKTTHSDDSPLSMASLDGRYYIGLSSGTDIYFGGGLGTNGYSLLIPMTFGLEHRIPMGLKSDFLLGSHNRFGPYFDNEGFVSSYFSSQFLIGIGFK